MRLIHPFIVHALSIFLVAFAVLTLVSCGCSDGAADGGATALSTAILTSTTGEQATTTSTAVITESTATTVSSTQSTAQQQVQVPDLVGMVWCGADSVLGNCGLECETEFTPTCDPLADGLVSAQDPAAGAWVSLQSVVTIEAWRYMIPVPDVVGMTEEDATLALDGAGFSNLHVTYVVTLTPTKMGKVTEQNPDPGVLTEPAAQIELKVGEKTPPMSM